MQFFFLTAVILLGMLALNVQADIRFWLDTVAGITRRYQFHSTSTNGIWWTAKETPKRRNASLLTLSNAREADWVDSRSEIHQWISANKGTVYDWAVDEPTNYENWHPQGTDRDGCVCKRDYWENCGCGAKLHYTCKKELGTKSACDSTWKKRGKYCYKFSGPRYSRENQKTWYEANSTCVGLGAHLAWLEDKEEDKWVSSNARGWLGLNSLHRSLQWSWTRYGHYDSYDYMVPVDTEYKGNTRHYDCYFIHKHKNVWKKRRGRCLNQWVGYTWQMPPIDIDGSWSGWSDYSQCSITRCGGRGVLRGTRKCDDPLPGNNGKDCVGNNTRTIKCNVAPCPPNTPVHGGWSEYGSYSACSKTCGEGQKRRTRTCTNPAPALGGQDCTGSAIQTTVCNEGPPCPAINGGWSEYGPYSACSKTCGDGMKTRTRTCTKPAPANGGANCAGRATEITACKERSCRVDGGWSAVTCSKTLTRTCTNPAPVNGGANCKGVMTETVGCDDQTWNNTP